jgi:hypothetical protein
MSGAAATARRAAAVGLAAIPAALAGASWLVLAALVVATLMVVVAAVCWAIADPGRARRLAALIRACRQPALPATARGRPAATGRRPQQPIR